MNLCVSIHAKWNRGKHPDLPKPEQSRWFWYYNRYFENEIATPAQLLGKIRQGYGFTTWHRGYRKADNFILGQHIGIDIDHVSKSGMAEILVDSVTRKASFAYTTPSHTPHNPRYRLVFVLDEVIRNPHRYVLYVNAVLHYYKVADKQCKDPCRIFFGSPGCDVEWYGETLPISFIEQELLPPYEEERERIRKKWVVERPVSVNGINASLLFDEFAHQIATAEHGEKHHILLRIATKAGGYVAAGYIDREKTADFLYTEIQKRSIDSKEAARETICNGIRYGMTEIGPIYVDGEYYATTHTIVSERARVVKGIKEGAMSEALEWGL